MVAERWKIKKEWNEGCYISPACNVSSDAITFCVAPIAMYERSLKGDPRRAQRGEKKNGLEPPVSICVISDQKHHRRAHHDHQRRPKHHAASHEQICRGVERRRAQSGSSRASRVGRAPVAGGRGGGGFLDAGGVGGFAGVAAVGGAGLGKVGSKGDVADGATRKDGRLTGDFRVGEGVRIIVIQDALVMSVSRFRGKRKIVQNILVDNMKDAVRE